MGSLTGLLYGAHCSAVYLGGWYAGKWNGNFSLLLFILTVVDAGLYWLAERFVFAPAARGCRSGSSRSQDCGIAAPNLATPWASRRSTATSGQARESLLMQPWWLDWTAGLFPVILAVFLLRSFLFEPFKIPSGSMLPTLLVGDLILVNKYHYGVRLPVINRKIVANHDPQRGDVMVFRYPKDHEHRLHQARRRRAGRRDQLPSTRSCHDQRSRRCRSRRCRSRAIYDEDSACVTSPEFKRKARRGRTPGAGRTPQGQPMYGPPDRIEALPLP